MAELKENHAAEIERLKDEHAQEIQQIQTNAAQNNAILQAQIDAQAQQIDTLKQQLAEADTSELRKFIPKWSARFNALVQYAKAMDRAAERINLEESEPKAIEYIRSMSDMIRFCADDLKSVTEHLD